MMQAIAMSLGENVVMSTDQVILLYHAKCRLSILLIVIALCVRKDFVPLRANSFN